MKRSWWRTGPPVRHTQPIARPTGGQLLRQAGLLVIMFLIWAGGFFVFAGALSASLSASLAQVLPANTPFPAPTAVPTVLATTAVPATKTALPKITLTATAAVTPTGESTATLTAESTATLTAESTATLTVTTRPTAQVTITATKSTTTPGANLTVSFQKDVQPIFTQVCVKCHGGDQVQHNLSLKTYDDVMQGSENGPVIVPGDVANSFLIEQIETGKMPKRGPKLLPKQIQAIVAWVAAGAPDN